MSLSVKSWPDIYFFNHIGLLCIYIMAFCFMFLWGSPQCLCVCMYFLCLSFGSFFLMVGWLVCPILTCLVLPGIFILFYSLDVYLFPNKKQKGCECESG